MDATRGAQPHRSRLMRSAGAVGLALAVVAGGSIVAVRAQSPDASGAATGTKHVSILDRDMTDEEIAAAVAEEGGLVIANWTYTANDEIIKQFTQYVKDNYGADIAVTYEGTQAPNIYLTNLYTAQAAGNPAPYDVMNIEENYWADAMQHD